MRDNDPKLSMRSKLLLWALSPILLVALLFFLIALPFYLLSRLAHRLFLRAWFELTLGAAGKRILLVYSRSPNWQDYVESLWLPRLEPHVVVVNWSDRSTWGYWPPLPVRLFRFYAAGRDYNPMVVLFPRSGRAQVIRLFHAFRDFKHGRVSSLRKAEEQVFMFCETLGSRSA